MLELIVRKNFSKNTKNILSVPRVCIGVLTKCVFRHAFRLVSVTDLNTLHVRLFRRYEVSQK